jgi:hypothetical protein
MTGTVLMPAMLSAKLFVEAAKVGGFAFTAGLKSAVTSLPERKRTSERWTDRQ